MFKVTDKVIQLLTFVPWAVFPEEEVVWTHRSPRYSGTSWYCCCPQWAGVSCTPRGAPCLAPPSCPERWPMKLTSRTRALVPRWRSPQSGWWQPPWHRRQYASGGLLGCHRPPVWPRAETWWRDKHTHAWHDGLPPIWSIKAKIGIQVYLILSFKAYPHSKFLGKKENLD